MLLDVMDINKTNRKQQRPGRLEERLEGCAESEVGVAPGANSGGTPGGRPKGRPEGRPDEPRSRNSNILFWVVFLQSPNLPHILQPPLRARIFAPRSPLIREQVSMYLNDLLMSLNTH